MKKIRVLLASTGAAVRTAKMNDRDFIVVPIVALVEGVIHASNAKAAELVLASELAKTVPGWNGRPVMLGHPTDASGNRISANDPEVLAKECVGVLYNARLEDKKLLAEAWIDVEKAESVSPETLARLRAGEVFDVSVGVFTASDEKKGSYNNTPYSGSWREIMPDHLALLPDEEGACSVAMGCGTHRAAEAGGKMKLKDRFLALIQELKGESEIRDAEGESDSELRSKLSAVLRGSPGYAGIEAVYPDDKEVVYCVMTGEGMSYYRCSYKIDVGGNVALGNDMTEVTQVTRFEAAADGCGCAASKIPPTALEGVDMEKKKEFIAKILSAKKPLFVEADRATLETLSEERLKVLSEVEQAEEKKKDDVVAAPAPTPTPVATVPVAASAQPKTPEQEKAEFLGKFPEIKAVLENEQLRVATRKTELITAMVATKQDAYTEDELKAMDLPQLEKVAKLAAASAKVDFSGHGAPRKQEDNGVPKPIDMGERLRAARKSA